MTAFKTYHFGLKQCETAQRIKRVANRACGCSIPGSAVKLVFSLSLQLVKWRCCSALKDSKGWRLIKPTTMDLSFPTYSSTPAPTSPRASFVWVLHNCYPPCALSLVVSGFFVWLWLPCLEARLWLYNGAINHMDLMAPGR